jgi:hypothetical protein
MLFVIFLRQKKQARAVNGACVKVLSFGKWEESNLHTLLIRILARPPLSRLSYGLSGTAIVVCM